MCLDYIRTAASRLLSSGVLNRLPALNLTGVSFVNISFVIGLLSLLASASLLGCDPSINATNPFDPEANVSVQLSAEVTGRVVLSEQFSNDLWERIEVSLRRQRELGEPFQDFTLDTTGRFSFSDLNAGRYQLIIALSGFETERFTLNLDIGELTDLGDIPLRARVSPETGQVSVGVMGVVKRELSPESEQGGTVIEAFGTPFATVSASDGHFYLPLPPGQHTLIFSASHYQSAEGLAVQVTPDAITRLEDAVTLRPLPSQLRGSVSLEGRVEDVALSSVVVRLFEREEQPNADALQTVTLDEFGRFIFDQVPVRQLWVQVTCEGFYTQLRPARALIGETAEAGHFDLRSTPRIEPPTDAPLRGRVQYLDRDIHEGITVEVRRAGVLIAAVGTETTGEYALNLDTADYTLAFSAPLYLPQTLDVVWDEEDLRFEVEGSPLSGRDPVTLAPELSARLEGSLYSPLPLVERGPWPEVSTVRLVGERGVLEMSTDIEGHFSFEGISPGFYGLEVEVEGHLPLTRVFDLPAGGVTLDAPLNIIPLPPEVPATLNGRALLARGAVEDGDLSGDHAGIIVIAREVQDDLVSVDVAGSAVTNSAGDYRITLNRSDYQVQLSSDGYVPRSLNVFWSEDNLRFEVERLPEGSDVVELIPLFMFTALLGQNLGAEGDIDLDGIANGVDNCPNLFNPPSVFGELQADLDQDGIGDLCDLDQDGDDLTDREERAYGLDPRDADTDDDRLSDGLEVRRLSSSGIAKDSDGDGREDADELATSTPETPSTLDLDALDLDSDGLFELSEFDAANEGAGFAPADYDGDGLIDTLESLTRDSDGDRAADQVDGPGPNGDQDGDGFRNGLRDAQGVCLDPVSCDPCPTTFDALDPDSTPERPLPLDTDADGRGDACDPDDDNDGELDEQDVCRAVADPEQLDTDLDGRGDACDSDDDNDGISDERELELGSIPIREDSDLDGIPDGDGRIPLDNCILVVNPQQLDRDQDRIGDACDDDDDQDGVLDVNDNCPLFANLNQSNIDEDGFGDVCDLDDDNDGVLDELDNCALTSNPDQSDSELDGIGNACDDDDDNDGVLDDEDNCIFIFNPDQRNTLGGALGDACSLDIDGDGVVDGQDNCLEVANVNQSDIDLDGFGDVCDADPDGDLLDTPEDNCPFVFNPPVLPEDAPLGAELAQVDSDEDGIGDACDDDDDNDGVVDAVDSCPDVENLGSDQDRDGFDDACDLCVDTYDPLQRDFDEDGIGDACDEDLEGDGIIDTLDNCVTRFNADQLDLNANGIGDACERRFRNLLTDRDVTDLAAYGDEIWTSSESGGFTQWVWDAQADEGVGAYQTRRLTTSEGAPSNRVKHLAFNRAGDLKAVTDRGLVTHFATSDTWDLNVYDEAPEPCRGRHPVIPWAAAIDLDIYRVDDTMYVAFEDRVVRYRGGQYTCWVRDGDLPDFLITGVDVNPYNGDVWVSTNGGAYRYNQQLGWRGVTRPILRSDFVEQVGFTADEVWIFSQGSHVVLSGSSFVDFDQNSGWPDPSVMAQVTESIYGVNTPTGTVWSFDVQRPGLFTSDLNGVELSDEVNFHPTPLDNRGGHLTVGAQGQLLHQGYQLTVASYGEDEAPEAINTQDGALEPLGPVDFGDYIGPASRATRSAYHPTLGVWSAHADSLRLNGTYYTTENGLPNNRVRDLEIDAQQQVWVATAQGVAHRRAGRFYTYYPGSSLEEELAGGRPHRPAANEAYATTVDRDNRGWFGTRGGAFYFDGVQVREVLTTTRSSLPPTYALHIDTRGVLWAGTARGLYRRIQRDRDVVQPGEAPFEFEHIPLVPIHEPMLTQLASAFDGRLFCASPRGLFVWSPDNSTRQYSARDGLPANRVHDIFVVDVRPDPLVWVSTDAGLTHYTEPPRQLENDSQSSLTPTPYPEFRLDPYGITWVTLDGGYFEAAPSDPNSLSAFLFPFEISLTEVTRAQWASLTGDAQPSAELADLPEVFSDITTLTSALSGLSSSSDGTILLPTQEEWELSAQSDRLQHHTLYPWVESFPFGESVSDVLIDDGLRCDRALSLECGIDLNAALSQPLGQTSQGVVNLGGNIAEWISDADGYRLVGGSVAVSSNALRLSEWVESEEADLESRAPATARGARLVTRPTLVP